VHIREIGLHKQEVVRWCLNVCVTVVTRNGADSHQKNNNIRGSTVACSVMNILAISSEIFVYISLAIFTEHFHADTFFYKSKILL